MSWVVLDEKNPDVIPEEDEGDWEVQTDQDTSFLRSIGMVVPEYAGGLYGAVTDPFGIRNWAQEGANEKLKERYARESEKLSQQGLTPEQIQQQLGKSPVPIQEALGIPSFTEITGGKLLPQSPTERVLAESAKQAGEWTGYRLLLPPIGGAPEEIGKAIGKESIYGGIFGAGSQFAAERGQGPLNQIATGLLGVGTAFAGKKLYQGIKKGANLVKSLFQGAAKAAGTPEGIPKFLTEYGTPKAQADLSLSSKDLAGRVANVSTDTLKEFEELANKVSPETKITGDVRAADIETDIIKQNQDQVLNTISNEPIDVNVRPTEKAKWETVQTAVNQQFDNAKSEYSALYDTVHEAAPKIEVNPQRTEEVAREIFNDLNETFVNIPQESKVKGIFRSVLDTVGKIVKGKEIKEKLTGFFKNTNYPLLLKELPEQAQNVMSFLFNRANQILSGKLNKISSTMTSQIDAMKEIMHELPQNSAARKFFSEFLENFGQLTNEHLRKITAKEMLATKISINKLLEKADIIPEPVHLLRPLSRAIKEDVVGSLGELTETFLEAESKFAEAQRIYNNDAVLKLRRTENAENMTSHFSSPSNLERLNEAIGESPQIKGLADRMIVENITKGPTDTARRISREMSPYLSKNANEAAAKLVDYGDKLTSPGQQALARGNILQDIQKSAATGIRPDYTLKLMQNEVGYSLVKETLNRSPKGKQIFKSLQRMVIDDLMNSTIEKGVINFEKAANIFENPHLRHVIKDALGESGLKFFQGLEQYGINFSKNLEMLKNTEPSIFEKFMKKISESTLKYVFYGFSPKSGLAHIALEHGMETMKRINWWRVLEDKESLNFFKAIGRKNLPVKELMQLAKRIPIIAKESKKSS